MHMKKISRFKISGMWACLVSSFMVKGFKTWVTFSSPLGLTNCQGWVSASESRELNDCSGNSVIQEIKAQKEKTQQKHTVDKEHSQDSVDQGFNGQRLNHMLRHLQKKEAVQGSACAPSQLLQKAHTLG